MRLGLESVEEVKLEKIDPWSVDRGYSSNNKNQVKAKYTMRQRSWNKRHAKAMGHKITGVDPKRFYFDSKRLSFG